MFRTCCYFVQMASKSEKILFVICFVCMTGRTIARNTQTGFRISDRTVDSSYVHKHGILSGRIKRKVKSEDGSTWSLPIPYIISSDFDNDDVYTNAIRDGIRHWEEETCVTFKEFKAEDKKFGEQIIFRDLESCSSEVGKRRNGQNISIGRKGECGTKGIVAHEIGHALGFYHEHTRPDRHLYIVIHEENIIDDKRNKFSIMEWKDAMTFGIPYDYSSIMHYGLNLFTKNSNDTMSVLEDGMEKVVGSLQRLSFYDAKLANHIYCRDKCSEGLAWSACQNDGYRDPKNCSRCRCPDGWTGQYCTEVKPGVNAECGSLELDASSSWQTLKSPNYDTSSYPRFSECTWRIKSSRNNTRIVLKFKGPFDIHDDPCIGPCQDYVEIRHKDMTKAGPRYCCSSTPTKEIISHGNEALVLFRARSENSAKGFAVEYKMEACGCPADTNVLFVPACIETQRYQCNETIVESCGKVECTKSARYNRCYKEVHTECCNRFQRRGNICYHPSLRVSVWSVWSSCSKKCASGIQTRTRTCLQSSCSEPLSETQTCNEEACAPPVSWSHWSNWSSCTTSCGRGTQYRERTCINRSCSGHGRHGRECNVGKCPDVLSNWSAWSSCTKSCGPGIRSRRRRCLGPSCSAVLVDTRVCQITVCMCPYKTKCGWWFCKKDCTKYRPC